MEEERRLCYVGMTRAREELYMTYASSRMLYGGVQHNPPSRFLSDVDAKMIGPDFDQVGASYESFVESKNPVNDLASEEPRYVPELNEGDGVRHKVFGVGTVMEIEGDTASIYFKGKGAKKINIAFAPIEKL